MKSHVSLVAIALTISATVSALAQPQPDAAAAAPSVTDRKLIKLSFPENLEVKVLIEYVSKRLGINVMYDEKVGRKRVTLLTPTEIPEDSLLELLRSVLRMSELALVQSDQPKLWKVVSVQDLPPASPGQEPPRNLAKFQSAVVLTKTFRLDHAKPERVERAISSLLSKPGGNSFTVPDQKVIIVSDYADRLRRVEAMIALLDRQGPPILLEFIKVEHNSAEAISRDVTSLLRERNRLAGGAEGDSLTLTPEPRSNQIVAMGTAERVREAAKMIQSLDKPSEAATVKYRFDHIAPARVDRLAQNLVQSHGVRERYASTIDPESGLLIVTGSPRVQEMVASLKEQLDVAATADASRGNVRFYKLTNSTAGDVLATVRSLLGTGDLPLANLEVDPDGAPSGSNPYNPRPNTSPRTTTRPSRPSVQTARTEDATVTADPNTNTIIVVAAPEVQRVYEQLIRMLDKRRPQVMVEVTLVTLDTSGNFSLGVELSKRKNIGGQDSFLTFSSFGLSTVGVNTGALQLTPGVGFNGVLLAPSDVNVVVRALATSGRAKVLSAPKVLVNDNATATLSSVSEAPFSSVNASSTVATTSFAGYASAGTTIDVTPHISEGDHLQIDYAITLNSFTGDAGDSLPPPRQTNSINSEVTVPNGHAVIIGGLTRKDVTESVSKIPWLGDLPLIKHLARSTTRSNSQSTLFVFLRPVILRDDAFEDLKYLSEQQLQAAELPSNYPTSEPMVLR